MGISKIETYSEQEVRIADYAKALGHPARLSILQFLLQQNSCVCGDIVDTLPLSQSTVSQHLKELKKVGLIKGSIEGPKTCYCINVDVWEEVMFSFNSLFAKINNHKINCC